MGLDSLYQSGMLNKKIQPDTNKYKVVCLGPFIIQFLNFLFIVQFQNVKTLPGGCSWEQKDNLLIYFDPSNTY
jgi:hypothetical protein